MRQKGVDIKAKDSRSFVINIKESSSNGKKEKIIKDKVFGEES